MYAVIAALLANARAICRVNTNTLEFACAATERLLLSI